MHSPESGPTNFNPAHVNPQDDYPQPLPDTRSKRAKATDAALYNAARAIGVVAETTARQAVKRFHPEVVAGGISRHVQKQKDSAHLERAGVLIGPRHPIYPNDLARTKRIRDFIEHREHVPVWSAIEPARPALANALQVEEDDLTTLKIVLGSGVMTEVYTIPGYESDPLAVKKVDIARATPGITIYHVREAQSSAEEQAA